MTPPRSREEIEKTLKLVSGKDAIVVQTQFLGTIIELLLDCREALTKKNPTDV